MLPGYIQMELERASEASEPRWSRRPAGGSEDDRRGADRRSASGLPERPVYDGGPMFERTALPDGPRVISARLPGLRSLSAAVYVLAGSRAEERRKSGLAHFMEHITFKGTRDLPATREVSEAIECVGGSCNAATDRECTVYWMRLPVREADRAGSTSSPS